MELLSANLPHSDPRDIHDRRVLEEDCSLSYGASQQQVVSANAKDD